MSSRRAVPSDLACPLSLGISKRFIAVSVIRHFRVTPMLMIIVVVMVMSMIIVIIIMVVITT